MISNTAISTAKFLVSGTLIAFLLSNADSEALGDSIKDAKPLLILAGFTLIYLHFFLGAYRWRLIAKLHGANRPISYYFFSVMVANFFNNFLPSIIGGDIVRVYDTWRAGANKSGATATVVVDRTIGLMALAIIAAVAASASTKYEFITPDIRIATTLAALCMVAVVAILFYPPAWWIKLVQKASERRLAIITKFATLYAESVSEFKDASHTLTLALILSFCLQLNGIFIYYLVAMSVGIDLPFSVFLLIIPLAVVVMMIPISINGIGLREGIFTVLLGAYGVSVSSALVFSWTYYALMLCHGLVGGFVYFIRKERPSQKQFIALQ